MRLIYILACFLVVILSGCMPSNQSGTHSEAEQYEGRFVCEGEYLAYITDTDKVYIAYPDGTGHEVQGISDAVQLSGGENEFVVLDKDGNLTFFSVLEDKIIDNFPTGSEMVQDLYDQGMIALGGTMIGVEADWKKSLSECNNIEKLFIDYGDNQYFVAESNDKSIMFSDTSCLSGFLPLPLVNDKSIMCGGVRWGEETKEKCEAWEGISDICSNGTDAMGLKSDGTVICTNDKFSSELSDWSDITDIECGGSTFLGLKADGTVLSLGGEMEFMASDWSGINQISASYSTIAGLRSDGKVNVATVSYVLDFGQSEAKEWTDIVYVQASYYYILGVRKNGDIITTPLQEGAFKFGAPIGCN